MELPQKQEGQSYGFFGYPSYCIHWAINNDNVNAMKECIENKYADKSSKTIDNIPLSEFARQKKAIKCAEYLEKAFSQ